jgi:hypothetical protein
MLGNHRTIGYSDKPLIEQKMNKSKQKGTGQPPGVVYVSVLANGTVTVFCVRLPSDCSGA